MEEQKFPSRSQRHKKKKIEFFSQKESASEQKEQLEAKPAKPKRNKKANGKSTFSLEGFSSSSWPGFFPKPFPTGLR